MSQRPDLSKLTSNEKDALIYALVVRVEELERRLGLDSSNSGKPPSSAGYKKRPRPLNLRAKTDKKSGGQDGHEGKTLRQVENPAKVVDHCPGVCAGCGAALGLEEATGHRKRQVFDLLKPLQAHKDKALRFLTNPEAPFTNNLTERDLRMMKLKQKISGCFRAETSAQTFAILRTVLSTARKQGWNILNTLAQLSPLSVTLGRLRELGCNRKTIWN